VRIAACKQRLLVAHDPRLPGVTEWPKLSVTLGRARPVGHSPADMAADHFNHDRNSARIGNSLVPTAQEAKAQAIRIYEALDAKGYGIVERQHAADALADSKVRILVAFDCNSVIKTSNLYDCSISLRVQTCSRSSKRCTWTQREQSAKHCSSRYYAAFFAPLQLCCTPVLTRARLLMCLAGVCSVLPVSQCQLSFL